ncbi:hypothetical protein MCOR26_010821, partial [Pyricularia oryzae]
LAKPVNHSPVLPGSGATRPAAPVYGTREPPWKCRAGARRPPTGAVDPVLCPSKKSQTGA